jgi:hypothetical protein
MSRTCRAVFTCHDAVQAGRERPPGTAPGTGGGGWEGVAHAPEAITTANRARQRAPRVGTDLHRFDHRQLESGVAVADAATVTRRWRYPVRAALSSAVRSGRMRPGSSSPCSSSHSTTVSLTRGKRVPPFVFPVFFQPQPGDIDRFLSGNQGGNSRDSLRFPIDNRRFPCSTRNGVTCHC